MVMAGIRFEEAGEFGTKSLDRMCMHVCVECVCVRVLFFWKENRKVWMAIRDHKVSRKEAEKSHFNNIRGGMVTWQKGRIELGLWEAAEA